MELARSHTKSEAEFKRSKDILSKRPMPSKPPATYALLP